MKKLTDILITVFILAGLISFLSCKNADSNKIKSAQANHGWKKQFDSLLPLLGHRNWIVVADKAFPLQTSAGIEYINTNDELLPVLQYVLEQVNGSAHVNPIIYRDKELSFLETGWLEGLDQFRNASGKLLSQQPVQYILHDSVFTKLDEASRQFKVLVVKTNETIPYTSVFLQLDCAYWNSEKETWLRNKMKQN